MPCCKPMSGHFLQRGLPDGNGVERAVPGRFGACDSGGPGLDRSAGVLRDLPGLLMRKVRAYEVIR